MTGWGASIFESVTYPREVVDDGSILSIAISRQIDDKDVESVVVATVFVEAMVIVRTMAIK